MLQLTQGQTNETIIVTLNEMATITDAYYLFVFTQVTTKQVVTKIFSSQDDESDYPARFNQFSINTTEVFDGCTPGEWLYAVYEQESSSNTDVAGLNVLEHGKLRLNASVQFNYTQYSTATTYKTYNG